MSTIAWIVTFLWPVAVIFAYSLIDEELSRNKDREVIKHFNMAGQALKLVHEDLERIKAKVGMGDNL